MILGFSADFWPRRCGLPSLWRVRREHLVLFVPHGGVPKSHHHLPALPWRNVDGSWPHKVKKLHFASRIAAANSLASSPEPGPLESSTAKWNIQMASEDSQFKAKNEKTCHLFHLGALFTDCPYIYTAQFISVLHRIRHSTHGTHLHGSINSSLSSLLLCMEACFCTEIQS